MSSHLAENEGYLANPPKHPRLNKHRRNDRLRLSNSPIGGGSRKSTA
jgi:hypothetical protein